MIELQKGLRFLGDGRAQAAQSAFRKAKALSSRTATIRELLGLASYQTESWEECLREMRTFRRLTGDSTQMPVELDCLRALGRDRDIPKLWETFQSLDVERHTDDEMRVVMAAWLLDRDDVAEAWKVIQPGRLVANPAPSRVRRWAVAARVAHAAGDPEATEKFLEAIRRSEPDVEWLAELEADLTA